MSELDTDTLGPWEGLVRAEMDISARLCAATEDLAAKMAAEAERRDSEPAVWPVPLPAVLGTGTATVDLPDTQGPHSGSAWDLRQVRAAGFTTGTVAVYLNAVVPQNLLVTWPAGTPGLYTFTKGERVVLPGDRLVWQFTGVDQAYTSGTFTLVPLDRLPAYLAAG